MKKINDLVAHIAERAKELADEKIDTLRAGYPLCTETASELIRHCKEMGWTRGQMIEAYLLEEFDFGEKEYEN